MFQFKEAQLPLLEEQSDPIALPSRDIHILNVIMPLRRPLRLQNKNAITPTAAPHATVNLSKKSHDVKPQAVSFN